MIKAGPSIYKIINFLQRCKIILVSILIDGYLELLEDIVIGANSRVSLRTSAHYIQYTVGYLVQGQLIIIAKTIKTFCLSYCLIQLALKKLYSYLDKNRN